MSNKLLLNNKNNKIQIAPLCDMDVPDDKIKWCENIFNQLKTDKKAVQIYDFSSQKKGYQVSVWKSNDLYYLIQCLKGSQKNYNTIIFIDNNENDILSTARFLSKNIVVLMQKGIK